MGQNPVMKFIYFFDPKTIYYYHKRCVDNIGGKFMILMFTGCALTGGLLPNLISTIELPYYKDVGKLLSSQYQLNQTISSLPSSLKGAMGILSDSYAFFGYNKTSYMYLSTACATVASILVLAIPDSIMFSIYQFPALFFFIIQYHTVIHDMLIEGKYAEIMIKKPFVKSDLVTFAYFYNTVGGIAPAFVVAPWAEAGLNTKYLYFFALPIIIHPIFLLRKGCMIDDNAPEHLHDKFDTVKLKTYGKIFVLAGFISFFAICSLIVAFFGNSLAQFIYSVCAAVILISLTFYCMPYVAAKANIYMFLCDMVYFDVRGPMNYYFTANEDCVPGGPGFSYLFFLTYAEIVKIFANLFGIILFQRVVCQWYLRKIYWLTTLMRVCASCFDIIIVMRWNVSIGIPDEVMFMFGNTIIFQTVYMMDYMPTNMLIAKICPKKMETCAFAILTGFANYGTSIGRITGIFLQDVLNVYGSEDKGCNYDNLVWLLVCCSILPPLVNIANTFWLIPNVKISDDFVQKEYDNFNMGFGTIKKESIKQGL